MLKDKLVHFQGDVIGNTIIGTADRAYIPGNDEAAFRGAFFGENADEMGGAFNSVKPDDKYGSAYEYGDWGASSARPKPAAVAATPSRATTATTSMATTIRNRPQKQNGLARGRFL